MLISRFTIHKKKGSRLKDIGTITRRMFASGALTAIVYPNSGVGFVDTMSVFTHKRE